MNLANELGSEWKPLFRAAGIAALAMLALMIGQIAIFVAAPPPTTAAGHFELLQENPLLGLVSLDLVYMVDNVLLIVIWLALFVALRRGHESAMAVALTFGLMSIAIYFASNPSVELLSLANRHAAVTTDADRATLLSAGEATLATYTGTAFTVSYLMSAAAGLLAAAVMLRSRVFSPLTAYLGLAANALMLIPASAGTLGLIFSLLSLVPFAPWLLIIGIRLLALSRKKTDDEEPLFKPRPFARAHEPI